ncbi:unnamed protein product [Cuscuta europaea]|nr:unnamed protein product [Cuscuta europaea]
MRKALKSLIKDNGIDSCIEACEVFFVHLSEAARFYPIQALVSSTLTPIVGSFISPTYSDELDVLEGENGETITDNNDVFTLVKAAGPIDLKARVKTPDVVEHLLKNYSNLSKCWYVYALSGKKVFRMSQSDVSYFHMKTRKSLRCTLAVLCGVNLNKILKEWKKLAGRFPNFNREDYELMSRRVRELQEEEKVFVN